MGINGISPWSLLLILAILVLLFGTKRLRHLGKDLGMMIKSFQSTLETPKKSKKTTRKKTKK